MMSGRLDRALALIDAVNAGDPVLVEWNGSRAARVWVHGRRMSEMLNAFNPDVPELLQIAARAQHIERWTIPRQSYPEGRIAYLKWRRDLQQHHARRTGEIMRDAGYGEAEIERVGALLRKERLKYDADVQTLEDVVCLVFLRHEAPDFIAKHPDDKVRDILAKTARKLSARGVAEAAKLDLDSRLSRLLAEAIAEPREA
jgi:hypothetical protein